MKGIKTNLNLYRAFIEVYECKNLSAAAANLELTQPTLSYNIKELERQLRVKLFTANSRGVEPTKNADELYPTVRGALLQLLHAENAVVEFNDASTGSIKIHNALYFMPIPVGKIIANYSKSHPNVKIEITATPDEKQAADLTIFAYLETDKIDTTKHTVIKIAEQNHALFASPAFIKTHNIKGPTTKDKLLQLPFMSTLLKKFFFLPKPTIEANSIETLILLAHEGTGFIVGPDHIGDAGLTKIEISDFKFPRAYIGIKYSNELANKAAIALVSSVAPSAR